MKKLGRFLTGFPFLFAVSPLKLVMGAAVRARWHDAQTGGGAPFPSPSRASRVRMACRLLIRKTETVILRIVSALRRGLRIESFQISRRKRMD